LQGVDDRSQLLGSGIDGLINRGIEAGLALGCGRSAACKLIRPGWRHPHYFR
jgi:hypothetical protein